MIDDQQQPPPLAAVLDPRATPADWVPAFDGQRPPFGPGNTVSVGNRASLSSGAFSPRMLAPLVREIVADAREAAPWLQRPEYQPALFAWAENEARCLKLRAWVDDMAVDEALSTEGRKMPPLEVLRRWEATALTHRGRLGLDPLSSARLGRDLAATKVDLAQLLPDAADAQAAREDGVGE